MIKPFIFIAALVQGQLAFAKAVEVTIDNMKFSPSIVKAKVGDTIIWNNKDLFPHTATALNGSFDSQVINAGKQWEHRFKRPTNLDYRCTLHPTMLGKIIVE